MKTAYVTIKGFELMRMFKKGQLDMWKLGQGLTGEIPDHFPTKEFNKK